MLGFFHVVLFYPSGTECPEMFYPTQQPVLTPLAIASQGHINTKLLGQLFGCSQA